MLVNIEAERVRHGFSRQKLANALGISVGTYGSYIHKDDLPSRVLADMSKLFNCSTDYLLELSDVRTVSSKRG